MNGLVHKRDIVRERVANAGALLVLMLIGGLALIGPSGVLAWGEQASRLDEHEVRIVELQKQRAILQNRVALLHPDNVDPDYASELVRGNLNVAHPDEFVVELETLD
ncbi:FtsB family cell division protein [Aurantiacibacter gangjinensis]|uniref:Septum formation initiator n=1 Tax=Aurantiacibacter gangjinensis TaxID=502682 RepID=A0A0G9MQT4_9SPHN|nr:septum formation initiator family protein [Aurantiacibacter gangjinensis]APE28793.1 Cell division protein DivIC (FtsB), stabilizes FtsL against RasP cleavage [Aurantiacibacter gangjinensis]KLE32944.1 septum formation initiator [Aurantiacibacter gangjinensis]